MGAWIEIYRYVTICNQHSPSLPAWGRGLKSQDVFAELTMQLRSLLHGGVD